MSTYKTQTLESVVRFEQALSSLLDVTREHAPEQSIVPERIEDIPLQWADARQLLEAVNREEHPLFADLLRTLIVLRQMHAAYVLSTTEPPSNEVHRRPSD